MSARAVRALLVVVVVASPLAVSGAASAVGPGTFTKVTTPSGNIIHPVDPNATNPLRVAGQASADVTTVNIACLLQTRGAVLNARTIASGLPVTNGSFDVTVNILTPVVGSCRLRAIPTGVSFSTDYLGSYTGPILYTNGIVPETAGGTEFAYAATADQGTGFARVVEAGTCGVAALFSVVTASMDVLGPSLSCGAFLPARNLTSTGVSTASTVTVDGHSGYLPPHIGGFLNRVGLSLAQTTLTTSFIRHPSGDVTVTESAPLVRCSGGDTYPPTQSSCPSLVSTGATFARTIDMFRGDHQVRFRDSFASADGLAHTVTAQYQTALADPPPTGATGYVFPGAGGSYEPSTPDEVVVGLGTKAGTVLARSDLHSTEGDPDASTIGITWSRAPAKVQFDHSTSPFFAMPYSFRVPAGGKAYVGFAFSEGVTTAAVRTLASLATREIVLAPTIRSPKRGATVHGHLTTVKGSVSLGANGLPTSVTVNGHKATLTKVSETKETYVAKFRESFGKHKLTVTAKDAAGNTASATRTIRNAP
jgi:hypothetical protein